MTARGFRALSLTLLCGAFLCARATPLQAAAKVLGPSKCTSCHDHEKQAAWETKDTHAKALAQLEDKKAAGYAKAIGLADPYDLKGTCVGCHATVFNGDANAGVSCERCHGPGSDYVQPHQEKGTYPRAVALGMFDTRGNLPVWAKMCVDCHVLKDAKLIAAGHKSGADFDVGPSSQKIVHWGETYDYAKLSAAGKAAAAARSGGAAAPKPEAAKPPPPAPPTAAPVKPTLAAAETRPTSKPSPEARPTPKPAPETRPPAPAATAPPAPSPPPSATAVRETKPGAAPPVSTAAPARPTAEAAPAAAAATPEIAIVIEASPIPTRAPTRVPPPRAAEASPAPAAPPGPLATASPKPASKRPPAKRPAHRRVSSRPTSAATVAPAPTRTPTKRPAPALPPQRAPN